MPRMAFSALQERLSMQKKCGGPSHKEPVLLAIERFHKSKNQADGHSNWCKDCTNHYRRTRNKKKKDSYVCYYCHTSLIGVDYLLKHIEKEHNKTPIAYLNDQLINIKFKKCVDPKHKGKNPLPAVTDYFHKQSKNKDNLQNKCKVCHTRYIKRTQKSYSTFYFICAVRKGKLEELIKFGENQVLEDVENHIKRYRGWLMNMHQELWVCQKKMDGLQNWKKIELVKPNTSRENFNNWMSRHRK